MERDFPNELCLCLRGTYVPDIWYIDCEPIDERTVLTVNHLSVLSDPNFIQTFANLKRLQIKSNLTLRGSGTAIDNELEHLNQMNQFHQLEHLELHGVFVNKSFDLKLSGLKKLFYNNQNYNPWEKPFPQSLEVLGLYYLYIQSNNWGGLKDRLKVLIARDYTDYILQLVSLERLHLGQLLEDEKPRVFVARFPKLLLLDIFRIYQENDMNEILQELATLKPVRSIQFYHQGFEVSNEKFKNPELKLAVDIKTVRCYIQVEKLLPIAYENPGTMRPFFYFQYLLYQNDYGTFPTKLLPFEILKRFNNINYIDIGKFTSYKAIRKLLVNFRQLLGLTIREIRGEHFDKQFFDDLPAILKNLFRLQIHSELVFESLEFLHGFRKLLSFGARFKETEQNQQIIESIVKRKNHLTYPLLSPHNLFELRDDFLTCENYPRY